ncbi:hypothetical protein ONE63_004693 [Megalurothrips usitatus]|uniref:MCMDC2 N-terminal domain-containing protein n=1 Tax=Megalurothrips usitatus TaxID=439358 RepID=A0AAV7X193_9NEOP|nr:hypothetical protein ONE63_004693 [Megalurothrips usitatus]
MYVPNDREEPGPSAAFEQEVRVHVLRYLDRSGHLAELERAGDRYKESALLLAGAGGGSPPSLTYTLRLDLAEMADVSGEACSLVLEQPLLAVQLFRDVVHCAVATLCRLPTLTPDQVQVVLRVSSLPAEAGLRTDGTRRPDPQRRRLLLLQQVAVAVTAPTKYTRSAVFRCPTLSCPGAAGVRAWGAAATRRRCRYCGLPADETPRTRDVGEQVLALMVRPDVLRAAAEPRVGLPVLVRLTDDLARPDTLQLGRRYDVVVLTACSGSPLEAWGVRPWQDGALRRVSRGLRSEPLPPAIQSLWVESSASSESPWAFAVSLAAQLSLGRYPAQALLHAKLGVLLSLCSQAGTPAAAGASRSSPTGAWLHASPLVLAQGGVCLLGCWDKWNRTPAGVSVIAALESGRAALESRDLAAMQLPEAGPSQPLQCAVWTYWAPSGGGGGKPADLLTLRTLLNTLGAPVLADSGSDEEMEAVCDHILFRAAREGGLPWGVLEEELSEFLALVNAQPVTLTEEATRLIQEYFVASRRVRPNCLPVTAVGTMAAMAEALARVSLRLEATWADVVLVVWMYELAFTVLFGPCLICPLPDICGLPFHAGNLTEQVDCRLNSMKIWLENFTKSVLLSSLRVQRDNNWS